MDNSAKKKAAVSAVAAVTAASVLVGSSFSSPADLLDDGPDALIQSLDIDGSAQDEGGDGGTDGGDEAESKSRLTASVRRLIRQAPEPVRALVALPLWLLGSGIIEVCAAVWGSVLSPAASTVLNWLAIGLIALAVFALAGKTIAPDLPLKKILTRRSIPAILLLCFVFCAADCILPFFWDAYESFARCFRVIASCICTGVPICFFIRFNRRRLERKRQAQMEQELSYEQREKAARELVLELADSVSRHY